MHRRAPACTRGVEWLWNRHVANWAIHSFVNSIAGTAYSFVRFAFVLRCAHLIADSITVELMSKRVSNAWISYSFSPLCACLIYKLKWSTMTSLSRRHPQGTEKQCNVQNIARNMRSKFKAKHQKTKMCGIYLNYLSLFGGLLLSFQNQYAIPLYELQ